jgi:hypothetical protein
MSSQKYRFAKQKVVSAPRSDFLLVVAKVKFAIMGHMANLDVEKIIKRVQSDSDKKMKDHLDRYLGSFIKYMDDKFNELDKVLSRRVSIVERKVTR